MRRASTRRASGQAAVTPQGMARVGRRNPRLRVDKQGVGSATSTSYTASEWWAWGGGAYTASEGFLADWMVGASSWGFRQGCEQEMSRKVGLSQEGTFRGRRNFFHG